MVNVMAVPVQVTPALVYTGVTVMVAVTGALVLLIAVKAGTVLVPLAPRPMETLLLVQLYTVPATGPVMVTAVVVAPLHTTWLAIAFTDGVGFTVMVKLIVGPVQVTPPAVNVGVTVTVATTGALVALMAVKLAILPVPAAARPMDGVLLVQLNTVPATGPVKVTATVADPLQTAWLAAWFTVGVGFTVMVKLTGLPVQLTPPLV